MALGFGIGFLIGAGILFLWILFKEKKVVPVPRVVGHARPAPTSPRNYPSGSSARPDPGESYHFDLLPP